MGEAGSPQLARWNVGTLPDSPLQTFQIGFNFQQLDCFRQYIWAVFLFWLRLEWELRDFKLPEGWHYTFFKKLIN